MDGLFLWEAEIDVLLYGIKLSTGFFSLKRSSGDKYSFDLVFKVIRLVITNIGFYCEDLKNIYFSKQKVFEPLSV